MRKGERGREIGEREDVERVGGRERGRDGERQREGGRQRDGWRETE